MFPHNLVEGKVENNRMIDVLIEKIIKKKKVITRCSKKNKGKMKKKQNQTKTQTKQKQQKQKIQFSLGLGFQSPIIN